MRIYEIDNIKIIFISLFLFDFLINGFTFIKYLGLYGALLFYLIDLFYNFKEIRNSYLEYFKKEKILFLLLFLLIFSIVISIIFSFSSSYFSWKEFRAEFLNIFLILLVVLSVRDKNKLFLFVFLSIIGAFIFDVFKFGYEYIKKNPHLNFSIRLSRNNAIYFEILIPFILIAFYIFKNKIMKLILFLSFLFSLSELFLTGARGAWITVFVEIVFIFFVIGIKFNYKKVFIYLLGTFFLLVISGYFLYKNSSLIQRKIHQGFDPSGRDKIIETRLPIFLKYGNFLVGIGGPGNYQYNQFLNHYHAPQILGRKENNSFHYWSDEPFLLQIFYKEGIIGFISFLLFSFVFMYRLYKNLNFFNLAILSSFIGYYFVRGLVEGRSFKYLILYFMLFLIFRDRNENSLCIS